MTPAPSLWAMGWAAAVLPHHPRYCLPHIGGGSPCGCAADIRATRERVALALDAAALHGAEAMREAAARECAASAEERRLYAEHAAPMKAHAALASSRGADKCAELVRKLDPARVLAGKETP